MMRVVNETTGAVLATRASAALTLLERGRGLLGTPSLPPGAGLVIQPCSSVHMLGMRYPLHVVYLDRESRVLWSGVLRPRRIGPLILRARTVLELPASTAGLVARGDRVGYLPAVEGQAAAPIPKPARPAPPGRV